jgi:hypothetical protein
MFGYVALAAEVGFGTVVSRRTGCYMTEGMHSRILRPISLLKKMKAISAACTRINYRIYYSRPIRFLPRPKPEGDRFDASIKGIEGFNENHPL